MIYLMKSNNKVKIGYSEDCIKRLKTFKTGNPDIVLVDTKPGNRQDENTLHKLCKDWHVTNEWYEDNENVRKIWNDYDPIKHDFSILKEAVQRYSTVDIVKILNPVHILFKVPGFDDIKNKYNKVEDIPNEVKEYLEYATNLMSIHAILVWIKYPLFDLPKNTVWKSKYKIWNNTITIPYREIVFQEILNSEKLTNLMKSSTKLSMNIISSMDETNISEELKELLFNNSKTVETYLTNEEKLISRWVQALDIISKFKSED